jgi:hypothetical protein
VTEAVPTVVVMSRRQATADQLVWRSLVVLTLLVVLWLAFITAQGLR